MSLLKWIEKNPLEAAALGTAAYFTGGAAIGAMGGGAAAGTAAGTAASTVPITSGVFAGATPAELLAANGGGASAGGGLLGGAKTAMGAVKPIGDAAGSALAVKGLLATPQQQAPQVSNHTDGGAGLSQLYGQIQQGDAQRMQEEIAKRQKLNGLFGGGNGLA